MIGSISDCKRWLQSHPHAPLDLVRIYLGVGLFMKGIYFLQNPQILESIQRSGTLPALPFSAATYVVAAHLVGGLFLAAGLLTRLAALAHVPIFYGAITYVYIGQMQTLQERQGFEFTGLLLFISTMLVLFGAGPWSLDQIVFRRVQIWLAPAPDLFTDLLRAFLGVALFVKGIFFMENHQMLLAAVQDAGSWSIVPLTMAHYVIPAHLAGGILLAIGMFTRASAAVQFPLLIGALIYVYLPKLVAIEGRQDFEFVTLLLFLVSVVFVFGPGRWSVDYALERSQLHPLEAGPIAQSNS